MLEPPELEFVERLAADDDRLLDVAKWRGRPVLVRRAGPGTPESDLVREASVVRRVAVRGVAPVLDLFERGGVTHLILDAADARPIEVPSTAPLSLATVLEIGCQLAEGLAALHRAGVVHCSIAPGNVLWDVGRGRALLTGLGQAQVSAAAEVEVRPVNSLAIQPHYASPEQTGRTRRIIDARSDLYSLGATLYALLAGRPPFEATRLVALLHAHMARTPRDLTALDPDVPRAVSAIVARLLEKRPEDRYQTALGVAADLQRARDALAETGTVPEFELRTRDHDGRLKIPERIYGRDGELMLLRRSFEDAARGETRVLLLSGYSGIGKTTLVREVLRSLSGLSASFVTGKLDQFERDHPYASIVQGLRGQVTTLLTQRDVEIAAWRQRILEHTTPSGAAVLAEVLPELSLIVGPLPTPEPLVGAEARNRFRLAVTRFVRALAKPDAPLVLFLDDLQWADLSSIELITQLATDPDGKHMLFIGAFRDNEVDHAHPLTNAIEVMQSERARLAHVELRPLSPLDTQHLVGDTVGHAEGYESLAALCQEKTGGNAFFLKRFLIGLHAEGLLRFDDERATWGWSLDAIAALPVTDNVVDFVSRQLRALPEATRRALGTAAVLGDEIELEVLAFALGRPEGEVLTSLDTELGSLLVISSGDALWAMEPEANRERERVTLRFVHDRIRQSARALIDTDEAARLRLEVGRFLWAKTPPGHPIPFDVVAHLNAGSALIDGPSERTQLAELNVAAARRAAGAAAFSSASAFFDHARSLLGEAGWAEARETTTAAHVEGARAAWLSGDEPLADRLVDEAVAHTDDLHERVRAREVRIQMLAGHQQLVPSMTMALEVLRELGVELSLDPSPELIQATVGATVARVLEAGDADAILALGRATDANFVTAARIQNQIMASAYLAAPALLPMLACTIVEGTLEHGACPESPYGFAVLALVLSIGYQIDIAYRIGELSMALLDHFDNRAIRPKPLHVFHSMVAPFVTPIRDSVAHERRVFELGMDTGDLEYAGWGLHMMVCNGFFAGLELDTFGETVERNLEILEHYGIGPSLACTAPFGQAVRNLRSNDVPDPARLVSARYDEEAHFDELVELGFRGGAYVVSNLGAAVRYLFGDPEAALEKAAVAETYADGAPSTYHVVWWNQFRALSLVAVAETQTGEARDASIAQATENLDHLKMLEGYSPVNHRHRVALVSAELARVTGDVASAIRHFGDAVRLAAEGHFAHELALAHELAGRCYLGLGDERAGRGHLADAHAAWLQYGAYGKAAHLAAEFDGIVRSAPTAQSIHDALDLSAVLKASSLVAGEPDLEALPQRILDVAVERAGATRGALIFGLEGEGDLELVAVRESADGDTRASESFPDRLVAYVLRTRNVVTANPSTDPQWAEVLRGTTDARSVICVPLSHRGVVSGALYLENQFIERAFSEAHSLALEHLATQAAISLDNLRQLDALETQRDQIEAALDASRAKSYFVANMSHELRTPLNAIIGYSEMLLEDFGDDPQVASDLRRIEESGRHLLGLISGILDVSKIEAGKMSLQIGETSVGALLDMVESATHPLIARKANRLVVEHDPTQLPSVWVDATKMRQILVNLLSNAARFTQSGRITLRVQPDGEHVVWTVADTGIGMTEQQQQRVLEPFAQATDDTAERYGGTGLGLTITAKLCELMQGELELTSAVGVGTTCTVRMPLRVAPLTV